MIKDGQKLDRNGYAPSLYKIADGHCALCGRTDRPLQRHEVFHGAYRDKAKAFGCWITICDECHRQAHADGLYDKALKRFMQDKAMKKYGWSIDDFRAVFGKNYLGGAE